MIEKYTIPKGLTRKKLLGDMKEAGIEIYNNSVSDADWPEGEQLPTEAVTLEADLDTLQLTNMTRTQQLTEAGEACSVEELLYMIIQYYKKHQTLPFRDQKRWYWVRCRNTYGSDGWMGLSRNPDCGFDVGWRRVVRARPDAGMAARKFALGAGGLSPFEPLRDKHGRFSKGTAKSADTVYFDLTEITINGVKYRKVEE